MSAPETPLRDALGGIADTVAPVDLYERSLRRSRRIGRRRAAAGTGALLGLLGLLGAGLWGLPPGAGPPAPPAQSRPAAPERSIASVPGTLFYARADAPARVLRLRPGSAPEQVVAGQEGEVAVSPDGTRLAYVTGDGEVMVAGTGLAPRRVFRGADDADGLSWTPDGQRLLLARAVPGGDAEPGLLAVPAGTFTPLPAAVADGHGFRLSGDGTRLVYGVQPCRLRVAAAAGGPPATVPVLGDPDNAGNPGGVTACAVSSVDAGGTRAAVALQSISGVATTGWPTAVVDLATGAVLPLPVAGNVVAVRFHPDGSLLVRSGSGGSARLTVFSPAGAPLVDAPEPPAVRDLELVAWTR